MDNNKLRERERGLIVAHSSGCHPSRQGSQGIRSLKQLVGIASSARKEQCMLLHFSSLSPFMPPINVIKVSPPQAHPEAHLPGESGSCQVVNTSHISSNGYHNNRVLFTSIPELPSVLRCCNQLLYQPGVTSCLCVLLLESQ